MASAVLDKTKIATMAGSITVHNFVAQTGEYTGSGDEYLAVGVGLPAHSTDIAPGVAGDGCVLVFTGQKWAQQEDHRGETVYSTTDRSASTIDYIGAIKDGFTSVAPTTQYDKWDGEKWVTDTDAQHAGNVASAAELKVAYIADANDYMNGRQWPGKAAIGRLKGDELTQYGMWLDYLDLLEAVDISSAPAISWPVKPE